MSDKWLVMCAVLMHPFDSAAPRAGQRRRSQVRRWSSDIAATAAFVMLVVLLMLLVSLWCPE